jgi:hypothetical protein
MSPDPVLNPDPATAGVVSRARLAVAELHAELVRNGLVAWTSPRTGQKRYINIGGPLRRSALGPGSPIRQQAMVSKAIKCGFESHPGHKKAHENVSGC